MTTTEQAVRAATRLARTAAGSSAGLQTCPYPPAVAGPQAAARRTWVREYARLRPAEVPPVDFRDDLLAVAHGADAADDQTPATVGADLFVEADA